MDISQLHDANDGSAPEAGTAQNDRCDRCQARSYVVAVLPKGALRFCAHHGTQYRKGLVAAGARIVDYTDELRAAA